MVNQFTTSVIVFKELKAHTQILMIHHKKFNKWMIPGGHIEVNENPNEAAIREVLEESGINIKLVSFIHKELSVTDGEWLLAPEYLYQQLIPFSQKEEAHYHIDLTYIGYALNHELVLNSEETNAVEWVPISGLETLDTFEGTKATIIDCYRNMLSVTSSLHHECK